ncbi:MAG: hypothetical protein JXR54_10000 [Tannerellaceae bacterium]|nr:hypothetical protein [Tannerellaceae bacterium]
MPEVGDKIVVDNQTFVYTGYGTWSLDIDSSTVVNENGVAADVIQDVNTENQELVVVMPGHKCSCNSTSVPLGAGESYTGSEFQSTLNYGVLSVSVNTDADSATDGLEIQWSDDGVNVGNTDTFTIRANNPKTFTFGPASLYYRLKYTNGATPQTLFNLNPILRKTYVKPSSHRIKDSIVADDDAELVKSVLTGEDPAGDFINFKATRLGNFMVAVQEYGDTPSIDPFARLRVSENFTIFDSKQLHDKQPLFWDESIGGSATSTHNPINAAVEMVVTASASDYVIRQTKQRLNYQPGKGALIFMTFYCPQTSGTTKRIGIFDGTGANYMTPYNGIFFSTDGDISWNIAKNGSITESITQNNWNVDTLDGSGNENNPSGITYVPASTQILIIDFEWLGVGRVRVGFVIDGIIRYTHYFNHANNPLFTSVYMSTPNLPLRYDIQSDGSAGCELNHICSTVVSEGGVEENGILRSVDTGATHVDASVADTTYAIIGIRLKAIYHDITVVPEYFSMVDEQGNAFRWSLQLNPIIAGTFTYSDITDSAVQRATGVTANTVTTQGVLFDSGYTGAAGINAGVGSSRQFNTSLRMGSTIDGVSDELVLCVTPLGSNSDIHASLTFRELL